jgi:hypothetical protein
MKAAALSTGRAMSRVATNRQLACRPALCVALAVCLVASAARAGEPIPSGTAGVPVGSGETSTERALQSDAEEHALQLLQKAREHFEAGEYAAAVPLLEQAYALTHSPRYLLNLAIAHHYLDECALALRYYEEYLDRDPRAERRAEATTAIEQLKPICGAPEPDAAPAPTPTPVTASAAAPRAIAPDASPPITDEHAGRGGTRRIVAWSLLGAGAATTIASVAAAVLALNAKADREALQRAVPPGLTWDAFGGRSRDAGLEDAFHRDPILTWVFAGSSLFLLGTGGALWLMDTGPHGSVSLTATGYPGVRYDGTF